MTHDHPNHHRVLLTGAAGFIGSHVAAALLSRGDHVLGLDNLDPFYDPAIKRAHLEDLSRRFGPAFEPVEGDVTREDSLAGAFARFRPTSVVHLAARAGVRPSLADPAAYMHANVVGTALVLQHASRAGVSRCVVASSSSVYGNAPMVPFREDMDVDHPISPYAASKRAAELVCSTHHHLTGLPIACLRFFTVFGPGQRPDLAISIFLDRVSRGEPITLFGDGQSSRDYTYIDDIVYGVLAAHDRIPSLGLRTWNLGGSHPVPLVELVGVVERVVGKPAIVRRAPMQSGDVERTFADLTQSERELGFAPRVPLEEGVRRQWEAARARRAMVGSSSR